MCDPISLRRFIGAPNAEVVRKRKTGEIVQVNLKSHGDDSALHSSASDPNPTYNEQLAVHTLLVLKRYDSEAGSLVRWGAEDRFSSRRFNPDLVETTRVQDSPAPRPSVQIAARPAEAPHVPTARFSVRCDPSLPWSAANSRDVY